MLTPRISTKLSSRWYGGVIPQEVDEFLGKLVKKYEELCQENEDLKASLKELEARLDEYSRMELTIVDTLENGQADYREFEQLPSGKGKRFRGGAGKGGDHPPTGPRGPRKQSPV